MSSFRRFLAGALLALPLLFAAPAHAQISLTALDAPYTQNFNLLATSGTTNAWVDNTTIGGANGGWYSQFSLLPASPTTYRADAGGSNTGAIYSWGTGTATERAFGSVASGTPGDIFNAVRFVNNTGSTITSLDVSYTGEQWRNGGNTTAHLLDFQFQVALPGVITDSNTPATGWVDENTLDFLSPTVGAAAAALDGNAAANRTLRTGSVTVSVPAGSEIWLRWRDINDVGNDHGLAIDDLSITPRGVAGGTADLVISKSDSPDPVTAGNNLTYTITLVNNGPAAAANASISDAIPTNTTFVSFTQTAGPAFTIAPNPPVGGTGTVSATIASLANSATATFSLVVNVNPSAPTATPISNTATATSTTADPSTPNTATVTTAVGASADLSITKTDTPEPVTAGGNITYTITVNNAGPSDAQAVTLTDAVPAGTTFVSFTAPAGWTPVTPPSGGTGNVTATRPTFAAGGSAVFTLVVQVAPGAANGSSITNTATIASTTTEINTANNSATATTAVLGGTDLVVTKAAGAPTVAPGGNITYTITVQNLGPLAAANVALSDVIPTGTTFVSFTAPAGWTTTTPPSGGTGTVSATNPSVAVGTSTFTLVVAVASGTSGGTVITNTASAATTSTDNVPGNNSDTETTTVSSPSALTATKTRSGGNSTGSAVTYTVVITNNGTSAQGDNPGDEFVDVLPSGLTLLSATASSGTAVANAGTNTVTWNGSIAAGASVTITIQAAINAGPGQTIANQGTVNFDADGNGTNESTTVTDDPATAAAGDPTGFIVVAPLAVPTLSPAGLLALLAAMGLFGVLVMRRRRTS